MKVDACLGFVPSTLLQPSSQCCTLRSINTECMVIPGGITNALDGTEDEEIWEEEPDSDPFEDLDEMDSDDRLYYADHFEQQQAEIDPECFTDIFGSKR